MNDTELVAHAKFLAGMSDTDKWVYRRNNGQLKEIVFSKVSSRNRLRYRLKKAFSFKTVFLNWRGVLSRNNLDQYGFWSCFKWVFVVPFNNFRIALQRDKVVPDGSVGTVFTIWEEDGEFLNLFSPAVALKVVEFLETDPTHPAAVAVLEQLRDSRSAIENNGKGEDVEM